MYTPIFREEPLLLTIILLMKPLYGAIFMNFNFNPRTKLTPSTVKFIALRLACGKDSKRAIAMKARVSPRTVNRINEKLQVLKLTAEAINALNTEQFYKTLYPKSDKVIPRSNSEQKYLPDFEALTSDMIERHLSIKDCYEEYKQKALLEQKEPV